MGTDGTRASATCRSVNRSRDESVSRGSDESPPGRPKRWAGLRPFASPGAYLFIRGAASAAPAMAVSDYEALAKNVVRRSLHIQPKENVIVECWNHGLDAAKEIVYQLRAVGARPMLLLEDEETHWRSVADLPPAKLGQVSASEWAALSKADAYVFFPGPADIARYRKNMEKSQAATSYNSDWYRRAERAGLRGARVLLGDVGRERARSDGFEVDARRDMVPAAGARARTRSPSGANATGRRARRTDSVGCRSA